MVQRAVLDLRAMQVSAFTKSRLGFTVAVVAIITILGVVAMGSIEPLRRHAIPACVVTFVIGFIAWLKGRCAAAMPPEAELALEAEGAIGSSERPPRRIRWIEHWGVILCLSASCIGLYSAYMSQPASGDPKPRPVARTLPPPQRPWPELEVRGLVCEGPNSSALINGRVLRLGEQIEGVRLVAVEPDGITVEWNGQTNKLGLAAARAAPPPAKGR